MYYVKTVMGAYKDVESKNHFDQLRKIANDNSVILEMFIHDAKNRNWIRIEGF